jgi:hypothetical protein
VLLAAGGVACASASNEPADPDDLVGCWRFEETEESRSLGLPWGLQLTEAPLEGWPGLPDARTARTWITEAQPADHPFGYWAVQPADSIRVGYPAGGGIDLMLAPRGPDLAGRGRAAGDALAPGDTGGPPPPRAVLAVRVDCPAG